MCFEVTQSSGDPCVFQVYEEFVDREAFEFHQQRIRTSEWGRVSVNVERDYSIVGLD
ncbi:putative quinol monooxygenase [Pseudomaricurvus sp.]|uniref:putative quinol monooxygenase n=1 Tax=Pseudomaricurvus sp. TaxID=2004510 RepID=UPI003F6D4802